MKLIGSLLVIASLVLGAIASATAYLPKVSLPDERLLGQELAATAAVPATEDEPAMVIGRTGDEVTPELLAQLREAGVERIRVSSFAFNRWSHWFWFLVSVVGFVAGGMMLRGAARMRYAAPVAGEQRESPVSAAHDALARIREIASSLRDELAGISDPAERCRTIVHRLDEVQRVHNLAIVEAKPALIASLGMRGFAEFMDRYSAGERKLNRAWSAAADYHAAEAEVSLEAAHEPLEAAAGLLGV